MDHANLATTAYRSLVVVLLGAIAYGQLFKSPTVRVTQDTGPATVSLSSDVPIKVEIVNADNNALPIRAACPGPIPGLCSALPVEVKSRW